MNIIQIVWQRRSLQYWTEDIRREILSYTWARYEQWKSEILFWNACILIAFLEINLNDNKPFHLFFNVFILYEILFNKLILMFYNRKTLYLMFLEQED